MIVRGKYPDYLMHYGRSIKDGAPGVGTGNWRRGGSLIGNIFNGIKSRIKPKYTEMDIVNRIVSVAAKDQNLVKAYENYKHYDMALNPHIAEYMQSERAVEDAKEWIKKLKDPNATDPEDLEWNENNPTVVNDVLGNEWKELFWDYEAPRNKKVQDISAKMNKEKSTIEYMEEKMTKGASNYMQSIGSPLGDKPVNYKNMISMKLYEDYVKKHGTPEHWTSYLKTK